MYASLLLLAWGAFLKNPAPLTVALTAATTLLLVVTAKVEERENLRYFGSQYQDYRRQSKMFIPFVF
jgi:protein-S-isoprenylcysteine O-methyltransferase Ste14